MVNKTFWKSKAFLGACLVVLGGALSAAGYSGWTDLVLGLGGALGIVGIRDAKGRLEWG